jgi:hypothetical protein
MTANGFADEFAPVAAGSPELQALLSDLLTVRGVSAAALAGVDGELLAGHAKDRAMLERVVGIITSALAAGTALGELFEDHAGNLGDARSDAPVAADEDTDGDAAGAVVGAAGAAAGDASGDAAGAVAGDASGDAAGAVAGDAADAGDAAPGGPAMGKIMLDFAGGPILVAPLPGGERVAVVVLEDAQGLGRARYALRGTMDRLSQASLLP